MIEEVKRKGDPEFAEKLREVADWVEDGTMTSLVLVGLHGKDQQILSAGIYEDRVLMLGALTLAQLDIGRS